MLISLTVAITAVFYPVQIIVVVGLVMGGATAVLVAARWPEAFLILGLWTNFMKSAYIPGLAVGEFGATPTMVFTALATIGFCVQILTGKRRLILPAGLWFLLLFVGFSTLSLLIVQSFRLAIGAYVRTLLDWMLFFSLIQMLTDWRRVRQLIVALLIQALIVVGWGIAAGIQFELTDAAFRSIFFWQQFQKNDFAAYLGLCLMLALATFSVSRSRLKRLVALILMVAVPVGWILTFSRGGFLAIVTCLIVFLVLERNKRLLQRTLLATLLVSSLGFVVITLAPGNTRNLAVNSLRSIVTGERVAGRPIDTVELRLELMQAGVRVIATRPVLGVGFNQWQFYTPIKTLVYDPQAGEFRETGYSIHNRYLVIAANNGLIALASYIGFLTAVLLHALRRRKYTTLWLRTYLHVFIAAVLGIQVALLFAPNVLWEWPTFGILIGIAHVAKVEKG